MASRASSVLLAIATELSELARTSLPKLRKGEQVRREWFENATLYRETTLDGQRIIAQFSFPQRKVLVEGGNANA